MRQAGRFLPEYRELRSKYGMLELCRTPELAAKVTLMPLERFELDAAIVFADILLLAPPMGIPFDFAKGEGPVIEKPLRSVKDVQALKEFNPEDLNYVLEALRLTRRELSTEKTLIGFAGAPFTLASYLIEGGHSKDYQRTKGLMTHDPKAWDLLMKKLCKATASYLHAQVKAGAQVVQIFDSWIGALTPLQFKTQILPHMKSLIAEVKKSGVPVIYFGTQTSGFLELFAQAGSDVVSVDWRIPLSEAWKRIGYKKAIQGNLDPALLAAAPGKVVKEETRRILNEAAGRPGHIFNLGHGILPETPLENVEEVLKALHGYPASR